MNSKKNKFLNLYEKAQAARKSANNAHIDEIKKIEAEQEEHRKQALPHSSESFANTFELLEIKADLSKFELKDVGTSYLQVFHPAFDTGSKIGIISKDEYNSLQDKEAYFKSVLENTAKTPEISSKYILAFDGEFIEPKVTEEVVDEKVTANDYNDNQGDVWKLETPEEDLASDELSLIVDNAMKGDSDAQSYLSELWDKESWDSIKKKLEAEGSTWYVWWMDGIRKFMEQTKQSVESQDDSIPKAKMTDEYEKSIQMETQKTESDYNKLSTNIINDLYAQLRQDMKFDSVNILSAKYNEDKTLLNVCASLLDVIGEKIVSLEIPVEDLSFKRLSNSKIATIVAKTKDFSVKIVDDIKEDYKIKAEAIEAEEAWKEETAKGILSEPEEISKDQYVEEKYKTHGKQFCPKCGTHTDVMDDGECKTCWNPTMTESAFLEATVKKNKIIEKKAENDQGGAQYIGATDVLNIEKHLTGLPEDLEIGTKVFIDGYHWELTCKNKKNLSKEKDSGSIWTFTKVSPDGKEPEHEINI